MNFFKFYKFFRRKKYNKQQEELLNKMSIAFIGVVIGITILSNFDNDYLYNNIESNIKNFFDSNKEYYESGINEEKNN